MRCARHHTDHSKSGQPRDQFILTLERHATQARLPDVKAEGIERGDTQLVHPGNWYDPISERWIAPRKPRLEAASFRVSENHVLERERTIEVQRIWRALVDCCARD